MLEIKSFTFNPFQENTYVLSSGSEAMIVDPGCSNTTEQQELKAYVTSRKLSVKFIINTHGHIDHVLGNDFARTTWNAPLMIHLTDLPVLQAVKAYAPNYGFPSYREALPDSNLEEGQVLDLGDTSCNVIFIPGHSPGHIGLHFKKDGCLISGDVLFRESIGRTDLPGGDLDTLLESIQGKLFRLPEETIVYPGHGDATSIGFEMMHNPFCAVSRN